MFVGIAAVGIAVVGTAAVGTVAASPSDQQGTPQ